MSQIWSISLNASSVGACALSLNADCRTHHETIPPDASASYAVSPQSIFEAISRCFAFLAQDNELPLLICICSHTTACLVDPHGTPVTPIYNELPLTLPRRDVPTIFADDPALFATYRSSLLRRLQQTTPLLGQTSAVGLSTAAALVIRALTGAHLDVQSPLGTLDSYPWTSADDARPMLFKALGVSEHLSCRRARAGRVIAPISDADYLIAPALSLDPWRTKLNGIPLMHMGSNLAASAYASAANPLSWACSLGWHASAQWTASKSAFSNYQIVVNDNPQRSANDKLHTQPANDELQNQYITNSATREGSGVFADRQIDAQGDTSPSQNTDQNLYNTNNNINSQNADAPNCNINPHSNIKELSRDDWTHLLTQKLNLQTELGARRSDACAVLQTPSYQIRILENALTNLRTAFDHSTNPAPWFAEDLLALAPVGSYGLHFLPLQTDITVFGLTNAHTDAHIVRAAFESQAYAIKQWRQQTEIQGLGPIRAVFSEPWDISCAQILCDIIGEPILVIDAQDAAHAALGAAVAAGRDLDILSKSASPHLTAWQLEPAAPAASVYDSHARIHAALTAQLD